MKKRIIVATVVALAGIGAGTASAAAPNCLGASASANAKLLHPYGQVVLDPNAPRNDFGTIGDAMHAVKAGQVDDSLFPNTCN
jgi:hypothetical protein